MTNFTNYADKFHSVFQFFLCISLIVFIIARYKKDILVSPDSSLTPNAFEVTTGIIYGVFAILNVVSSAKTNLILPMITFISTGIIIYSAYSNIKNTPLPKYDANDQAFEDPDAAAMATMNIDLYKFYNNKLLIKTILTFVLYIFVVFAIWFGIWKNNCSTSDLLCNQNFIFTMSYMAFSLFILLDMFRNTKDFDFFEWDASERNDLLLNNTWVFYSIFYTLYFIYVLIISQSIRNSMNGVTMDINFNFIGFITIFITILQFIHYFKLLRAREQCNCDDAQINVLDNNIKVFQFNSLFLPIVIITISILSPRIVS